MRIPNKIKVIGKNVKIKIKKKLDNETTLGQWTGTKKLIELKKDNSDMNEVFLHEIIECIDERCDLNLEHYVISTLSEVLFQVIKDNKLDFRR
jgi:hypothetical protein